MPPESVRPAGILGGGSSAEPPRMKVISGGDRLDGVSFPRPQDGADIFHMDEPQPVRATLRVLTTEPPTPEAVVLSYPDTNPCSGSYLCECLRCQAEKAARVRRGVRRTQPVPLKRAA